jgi:hypothetical protein
MVNVTQFGKGVECEIIGRMCRAELDCYMPVADVIGIDAIVKKSNGEFIKIQIKARSKDAKLYNRFNVKDFDSIKNPDNLYFILYSEKLNKIWILSHAQFLEESKVGGGGRYVIRGEKDIDSSICPNDFPNEYVRKLLTA